ncbi:uncharacterized protein LY89DRAFT_58771 [Mollisia scopiformis]|uniref:Uncharacterized protein n=1 Tax=Mollisia scopiformis TaxID=149040 RepID=A0A194XD36_MOLSC|nr:uncharacterized protein LY89DRAFT_58771 [Mollisia scopiformis]KUJ17667.1 hypothetical protein LY89DRAFT_58771 [Mollisia scopiformis]
MGIDSWLSLAGRTPELSDGPANLLRTAPALISRLMREFGDDFANFEFTATKGGLQIIQSLARELMQPLEDESLSEAEQIFTSVALLRIAKVALCIALESDTEQIRGYLSTDIQVYVA